MNTIDLDQLNPEQIKALEAGIIAKKLAEKAQKEKAVSDYKDLVAKTVREQIIDLQQVSNILSLAKANVFGSFASVIELKQELYGAKSGQQSHTFSDDNGNSITVGYRVLDKFDDTLDMGISLVNKYIESLATDEKSARLVEIINKLLKKDAKGNLKANRVVELQNLAEDINDENLTRGVDIIRKSYKPVRSAIFIEAETTDTTGKKQSVGLSITSVEFPEGFTPNFEVFK